MSRSIMSSRPVTTLRAKLYPRRSRIFALATAFPGFMATTARMMVTCMDWVHTNCGAAPTPRKPNGWLKIVAANGTPGSISATGWGILLLVALHRIAWQFGRISQVSSTEKRITDFATRAPGDDDDGSVSLGRPLMALAALNQSHDHYCFSPLYHHRRYIRHRPVATTVTSPTTDNTGWRHLARRVMTMKG